MNSRRLIQATLAMEMAVVVFAACAAIGLRLAPLWLIAAVTCAVIVLAGAAIGLARTKAGLVLGSLVPLALLAGGFWLLDLIILGVVFAGLWILCLVVARRLPAD